MYDVPIPYFLSKERKKERNSLTDLSGFYTIAFVKNAAFLFFGK